MARCRERDFTLRGLIAELGKRGLKVDYRSAWEFVHADQKQKACGCGGVVRIPLLSGGSVGAAGSHWHRHKLECQLFNKNDGDRMTPPNVASLPIHPGEILAAEFLAPHGLSRARLARTTGLSYGRLTRLARGRGRLDAEAALLLGRVFRTTPEFWLALQAHYDLERAQAQLTPAQIARAQAFGARLRRAHRR